MTFCAITPSRGDRGPLLDYCKHQVARMTVKPDEHIIIDHKPETTSVDLTKRVRSGVEQAIANGHEYAFIIEDDDWYDKDYFKHLLPALNGADFIGSNSSTYYNIFTRSYQHFDHLGRSSLFMTGFRLSVLKYFQWPPDNTIFLDLHLWSYATQSNQRISWMKEPLALGIKHGIGLVGGKGHTMTLRKNDKDFRFLRQTVDEESLLFYTKIRHEAPNHIERRRNEIYTKG
jgi:hypothetical protein